MTAEPGPRPPTRACVFAVGTETFAVGVSHVKEVVNLEELTRVPLAPAHVLGVANLRGAVVPVVDPAPALGMIPRPPGRRLRALVLAAGDADVALAVDDVLGLETFADLGARAWAPGVAPALLLGAAGAPGRRPVTVLDAPRLVAALRPTPER